MHKLLHVCVWVYCMLKLKHMNRCLCICIQYTHTHTRRCLCAQVSQTWPQTPTMPEAKRCTLVVRTGYLKPQVTHSHLLYSINAPLEAKKYPTRAWQYMYIYIYYILHTHGICTLCVQYQHTTGCKEVHHTSLAIYICVYIYIYVYCQALVAYFFASSGALILYNRCTYMYVYII